MPTRFGLFQASAFECATGFVYVALTQGNVAGRDVLARLHSECLTGDALGSLRCDCGPQLRFALRRIAAEGRGVLVYATGHEGRGIGLVNKLRAYLEQDAGADTLDANLRLGLAVDTRDYRDAADVLRQLGVQSVRLLTNNPAKVAGVRDGGLAVDAVEPLATAPHNRNLGYLRTKQQRLGHIAPLGQVLSEQVLPPVDASQLLGPVRPRAERPYIVLKFAQTLDGRIATATGDSKRISGEDERRVSHALRAGCDAVMVGIGTVLRDDPQLTVRMVPGASPRRVVLDSSLRTPLEAKVLNSEAPTTIIATPRASPQRRELLRDRHVQIHLTEPGPHGVDIRAALKVLRDSGAASLLVEGGMRVITSLLAAGVVDRLIVGIAPVIIGSSTEAVGELGVQRLTDGIRLKNRTMHGVADDVLVSGDIT